MIDCISIITPLLLTQSSFMCRPKMPCWECPELGAIGRGRFERFSSLTPIGRLRRSGFAANGQRVLTANNLACHLSSPPLRSTSASGKSMRGRVMIIATVSTASDHVCSVVISELAEQRHFLGLCTCPAFYLQKEEALGPFRAASSASASLLPGGSNDLRGTHGPHSN